MNTLTQVLNKHAPSYLKGNQGKFRTKYLHQVTMKSSSVIKFLRDRTETSRKRRKKILYFR